MKRLSTSKSQVRSHPLQRHLLFLAAGAVFPLMCFASVMIGNRVLEERENAKELLRRSAQLLSNAVDRELTITVRTLQALAQSSALERGDLATFYQEAKKVVASQPGWRQVILLSSEEQQLMNTMFPFGTILPSVVDPESLQSAIHTGKPTVGNLVSGAKGVFAFPVRVSIKEENTTRYILTAVMFPQAIQSLVSEVPLQISEWSRTILDKKGTIIARTRSAENFIGKPVPQSFLDRWPNSLQGLYMDRSLEGQLSYISYTTSPISGWGSGVLVPASAVDGPVWSSFLMLSAGCLAALSLSLGGAYFLSRRISTSITQAALAADVLSSGEHPQSFHSSVLEIERLGEALQQTSILLSQREQERNLHLEEALKARKDAESANIAKDTFIAMLGHELRNPLAPVRSASALLTRLFPHHEQARRIADIIERQVGHMARIIGDLLDIAKITRGKIDLDRKILDLRDIVEKALSDFSLEFEQANITLISNLGLTSIYVEGDETRLAQALGNLLHNAKKFTPRGKSVTVTLLQIDERAYISVEDEGVGIDPELLPRLFEPFSQGPQSLARTQGGLGLGLALVQGFIKLHNGVVNVQSHGVHKGTTFTLELPITVSPIEHTVPSSRQQPIVLHSRRIFIVEDNVDSAELLKEALVLIGHQVEITFTGRSGIEKAPMFMPEVVICDIGLPDINGFQVCRQLRACREFASTIFIALSGYAQHHEIEQALQAGFHLHLTKPVDLSELEKVLSNLTKFSMQKSNILFSSKSSS